MKNAWYIYSDQVVSGPYSTENVEKGLEHKKWSLESLVWWRGQTEWIPLRSWKENLPDILETLKANVQKTVWYIEHLGQQKGPMNAVELQQYIAQNGILNSCRVWTSGMEKWMAIFELPDLIEFMGITRRVYSRAPIKGEVVIQDKEKNQSIVTQLGTISEGGIGTKNTEGVTKGSQYDLIIKSPMLVTPIHSKAQAVYANPKGNSGFQFQSLQAESQSLIVSFVKQFKS